VREDDVRNPNAERAHVAREAEALRDAIDHIRNAKGVLDTFPETRSYVARVEKLADDYEKKLAPLEKQMGEWMNEGLGRREIKRPRS
jgi:uncharacterized Zn finger protein